MRKAAVIGAGKIGSTIASLLAGSGDYQVLVIDQNAAALADLDSRVAAVAMAIDDPAALAGALAGCFAVVNAAPYHLTTVVAEAAKAMYENELAKQRYGGITTEIVDAPPFYFAEDYHQQYLAKNPFGYCGLGGTGVTCPIGAGAKLGQPA